MKYENKRNGKVATVIEINEKFHTVMLEYNDGTTQNITSSTFKRWWKEVKEEVTEEDKYIEKVMEAKKEAGVEVMDLDPQDVVIVSETEKEEVDSTVSKKAVENKHTSHIDPGIRESLYAELLDVFKKNSHVTRINPWIAYSVAIEVDGKSFAAIRVTKKGLLSIYVKKNTAESLNMEYSTVNNYYLPAVIKGTTLDTVMKLLNINKN